MKHATRAIEDRIQQVTPFSTKKFLLFLQKKIIPHIGCGVSAYPCQKNELMATVRNNPIVRGLSGMLGQALVFRTFNGRTFISTKPKPPRRQSELQKSNRNRFKMASHWAQGILLNPERKTYYQKKAKELRLPNAYTAAIADYMRTPRVTKAPQPNGTVVYEISKKGFELKTLEVTSYSGASTTRTIEKNKRDKYVVALSKEELQSNLCIFITDSAEQQTELFLAT